MLHYPKGVELSAIGGFCILCLTACSLAGQVQEAPAGEDGAGDGWPAVHVLDAAPSELQEGPFHFSFLASYLYGPINGSIQIPSGGVPGTTSQDRPTLSELGINETSIFDVAINLHFGSHGIYAGGQFIDMSGSKTLQDTLVTHGVTFPAGTPVHSDVSFDWYRIGYEYTLVLDRGQGPLPEFTIQPAVGAGLFTFDYRIHEAGGEGLKTSRSFTKGMPQVGLELEWRPGGGPFAVSGGALGFPAIGSSTPQISIEHVLLGYQFVQQQKLSVDASVGVAFEQFQFEDGQHVPNRVRADLGPMFVVGIGVQF